MASGGIRHWYIFGKKSADKKARQMARKDKGICQRQRQRQRKDKGICHSTKWEINFYTEPRCAPSSVKFCKQSVNILWRKAVKTNTWGANVRENAEKRGRVQTAKTSQKGHLLDGQCQKFARFTHNGGYLCLKCCFGARSSCCFYIFLDVILLLVDLFELHK